VKVRLRDIDDNRDNVLVYDVDCDAESDIVFENEHVPEFDADKEVDGVVDRDMKLVTDAVFELDAVEVKDKLNVAVGEGVMDGDGLTVEETLMLTVADDETVLDMLR
jgi:hypothetical protein